MKTIDLMSQKPKLVPVLTFSDHDSLRYELRLNFSDVYLLKFVIAIKFYPIRSKTEM